MVFFYGGGTSDGKHIQILSTKMSIDLMQTLTREKKKKSPEIYSVNYETVHLNLTGNFEFVCHFLFSVNVFQTSKTFFKSYNISN